ncbi:MULTISPECIES: hypothetical protein [unclassified Sinorhizobium]|uniref:hypothetical protein n=1 Tax=unclassified Sinorhizobium TaxID=2613772 RepID=UPI0024C3C099|nr:MULTISPECIES: hypothetical protein [unclassified Sinorhizobium]MDK1374119.1 hypothetical protein [Sinorhizobium sp. 6-70]MDK1477860.1 hypothetical protein [Sinorhizobium sp. 6-117]
MAGRAEGGLQSPVYDYIAETVRSLLPAIERVGIASAAEVGIDTLGERLRKDCLAREARIMLPLFIGAWTRAPA